MMQEGRFSERELVGDNITGLDMPSVKVKIGFDLDGVVIDKPPFMPHFVMEKLVRVTTDKALSYRYPKSLLEQTIRILSHHPFLRPPIAKNIKIIKELYHSRNYELYVVSSRYAFLDGRTKQWFKFYKMGKFFENIRINLNNEQPHVFKKRMISKLKLNVFIDDDLPLLTYLKNHLKGVDVVYVDDQEKYLKSK